jgi:hypothetical protein
VFPARETHIFKYLPDLLTPRGIENIRIKSVKERIKKELEYMFKRGNKEFVLDMLLACENILKYTKGMRFEEFEKDGKTKDLRSV